ncbi:hypothetical protein AAC387_Pa04g1747 [Persea americana]
MRPSPLLPIPASRWLSSPTHLCPRKRLGSFRLLHGNFTSCLCTSSPGELCEAMNDFSHSPYCDEVVFSRLFGWGLRNVVRIISFFILGSPRLLCVKQRMILSYLLFDDDAVMPGLLYMSPIGRWN